MTRQLTRLADIAYRRRGRMVIAWIVGMIAIIGVGSKLKGEFNANYNTPGSESKAASDITQQRFGGYSGQEIYVVWKDPAGVRSPAAQRRMNAFFAQAEKVNHISSHTQVRFSQNGQFGTTTLPLTVPGWDVTKDQGKQLIDAAQANDGNGLEIKLGGDPINRAESQASPEGIGFLAAAIVLLIAFGSVVAAGLPLGIALAGLGISSAGLIPLLANVIDVPNWTTAVSGLIGIGVGIDYSLLVLTRFRTAMRDGKDRHDAVVEAVTTAGRSVIIAGCTVVIAVLGLFLTGLSYMYGVALSAAVAVLVVMIAVDHPAAGAALLPRPEGRSPSHPAPRPGPADGRRQRQGLARGSLEPHGAAASLDRGDRRHRDPARPGRAGPRHAARIPGCRQRPAWVDDPAVVRPDQRGLRPRHQRPGDRRRQAAQFIGQGDDGRPGDPDPLGSGRCLRGADQGQLRGRCGADPGDPEELASGQCDDGPRPPAARRHHSERGRRLRDRRPGRGRHRRARGSERVHQGPHAALHHRRGWPLVPAAPGRLPLAVHLTEGRRDEPAFRQCGLRRDDAGLQRGRTQQSDRHRP